MMDLDVIHAGESDFGTWDTFVASHPQGTIYHTSNWMLAGAPKSSGLLIAQNPKGETLGGFAYALNTKGGLRRILKPTLTARFGPLVAPDLPDAQKSLVYDAIFRALPRHDLIGLTTTDTHDAAIVRSVLSASERRFPTNTKTLPGSPDELLASYSSNIRRNIRQALAEGGRYVEQADADMAYDLFEGAYQIRGDAPRFSREQLHTVIDQLSIFGSVALPGVNDQNGVLVAALLLFYDEKRAFYVVSGTDRDALGGNAGALLVHFALRFAQDRGLLFDFNGSSIEGINGFFKKFNPDPADVVHLRAAKSLKGRLALLYESLSGRPVI